MIQEGAHYNPRISMASKGIQNTILGLYKHVCALCTEQYDVHVVPITPDSVRGRSLLAWLNETRVAQIEYDNTHDHILLCRHHISVIFEGNIVMCPPMEDLQKLIQEEKDRSEDDVKNRASRTVPSISELSGKLAILWRSRPEGIPFRSKSSFTVGRFQTMGSMTVMHFKPYCHPMGRTTVATWMIRQRRFKLSSIPLIVPE
ncbi:hypothetical protein C8Q74DRAFT_235033 [Fomes fomentarius]|nr:hypothetical protein C8Q74DRAFT_235033 [Fomes fomentarius]